jgi:hypothetical protein
LLHYRLRRGYALIGTIADGASDNDASKEGQKRKKVWRH